MASNTDSNTIIDGVNYGPLAALVGVWQGSDGMDIAPEPDADEHNPFFETMTFEAAGDVTNAEEQNLAIVHYKQIVSRKSNNKVFHQQVGYWLWDAETNNIAHSFTIPRAVAVVAEGNLAAPKNLNETLVFEVTTKGVNGNLAQTAFMQEKAKTVAFSQKLTVNGDELQYSQSTVLDIYGKSNYDHTDVNTLRRTS